MGRQESEAAQGVQGRSSWAPPPALGASLSHGTARCPWQMGREWVRQPAPLLEKAQDFRLRQSRGCWRQDGHIQGGVQSLQGCRRAVWPRERCPPGPGSPFWSWDSASGPERQVTMSRPLEECQPPTSFPPLAHSEAEIDPRGPRGSGGGSVLGLPGFPEEGGPDHRLPTAGSRQRPALRPPLHLPACAPHCMPSRCQTHLASPLNCPASCHSGLVPPWPRSSPNASLPPSPFPPQAPVILAQQGWPLHAPSSSRGTSVNPADTGASSAAHTPPTSGGELSAHQTGCTISSRPLVQRTEGDSVQPEKMLEARCYIKRGRRQRRTSSGPLRASVSSSGKWGNNATDVRGLVGGLNVAGCARD